MKRPPSVITTLIIFAILILAGCNSSDANTDTVTLPSLEFSDEYPLSSFSLSNEYDYWEIRVGKLPYGDVSKYQTLIQFDEDSFNELDEAQIQIITSTHSTTGFAGSCLPAFCPIYAVAIDAYTVQTIDSMPDLIDFFGEIDTESELKVRLSYAQDYATKTAPISYDEVDDGYIVLLSWDSLCQLRGEDLVKVYRDGTIEKIKEVSRESYGSCV